MNPAIQPLGDRALLIHFGERIDALLSARVLALTGILRETGLRGILDVVPAYASICVHYEPMAWADPNGVESPCERVSQALSPLIETAETATLSADAIVEIPVCYGGDLGPDLADVAKHANLDAREVIARHAAAEYRVAMLGFAPGFPYLLGLDAALHTPRRGNPRTRVPAGSVAIGGTQTGVYPRELPGGWHIVGRTPLQLFDITRDPPALLAPGQRVRFRAIDAAEFDSLAP
jgi:KipI family sensor histidine kinase inhibitor